MKTAARLFFVLALLAGLLSAAPVLALDPARAITQFKHTSWTAEDGAPTNIWAIDQSADGNLWLGAAGGLYRFDGVTFEAIPLANNDYSHAQHVNAVVAARSGAIWIGYRRGGVALLRDGQLRQLPGTDRLSVLNMAEDRDGAIWTALSVVQQNLGRFVGGRFQMLDASWNLPEGYITSLVVDRDGTLWAAMEGSLSFLRRGATRFERTQITIGKGPGLTLAPDGRLWVADSLSVRALPDPRKGEKTGIDARAYPMSDAARLAHILFDRDGGLWGTNFSTGVFRIARPAALTAAAPGARVETYEAKGGLSSNKTMPILQDREGNIWIGTSAGLDRLRTANVVVEPAVARSSRFGYLQFVDGSGAVYVGDSDTLYKAAPGQAPKVVLDHLDNPTALCQDKAGAIHLGLEGAVMRLEGGKTHTTPLPPPLAGEPYYGCVTDRRGNLWFTLFEQGYGRLNDKGWTVFPHPVTKGFSSHLALDRQDRVVLPTPRTISRVSPDGSVQVLPIDKMLAVGGVRSLYQGPKDFLIGCEFGLLRLSGDRFQALQVARFPWAKGIQGMVQTPSGETWMLGVLGVVRVRTDDLDRAFDDPRRPLNYQLFDLKDGLPGPPQQNGSQDVVMGGDGRVWFLTLEGVAWIDPAHIAKNTLPPPVAIRAVTVNGRTHGDPRDLTLPKGVSKLQIDYTALSLSIPERVRFRYRLEGVDKDWVEAGGRRQAFYTNLKPGRYRFRVVAANNDGVWNDQGATLAFEIPPTFVQTRLFLGLCVLALAGVLWGLYALRLRQVSDRIHGRLQERMAERERIARELHDTLLQGVQGLMLRLQSVADQIPSDQPARQALDQALDRADDVIVEGRDRVKSLRAEPPGDLPKILADVADRLGLEPAIKVRVVVEGTPRLLHPIVSEEIERIAAEALFNSLRHAQARGVEIGVSYGRRALGVRFRDDGVGLDQAVLDRGGREGHFGLTGMGERARKIQAEFEILSRPGAGAEIGLTVPAGVAYLTAGKRAWPFALRRVLTSET